MRILLPLQSDIIYFNWFTRLKWARRAKKKTTLEKIHCHYATIAIAAIFFFFFQKKKWKKKTKFKKTKEDAQLKYYII